jgi:hypothetical protein
MFSRSRNLCLNEDTCGEGLSVREFDGESITLLLSFPPTPDVKVMGKRQTKMNNNIFSFFVCSFFFFLSFFYIIVSIQVDILFYLRFDPFRFSRILCA